MHNRVRSAMVALLLGVVATPVVAQEIRSLHPRPERAGFWWGLGLGAANTDANCGGCGFEKVTFPVLDLQMGGTLSPKFRLGVQATGGMKSNAFFESDDIDENVGDLNVSAYFYPSESGNFWLQGGLAGVVYEAKDDADNKDTYVSGGVVLGAGIDLRVGRNMSVTPSIRLVAGGEGDIKDQDDNVLTDDFKVSFVQVGVSLIWH